MPENKKVRELMVPLNEYPFVYDTDTLKDAIEVLRKHRLGKEHLHRSILVFSKTEKIENEEKLIGILTVRDFLQAIQKNRFIYDNTEIFTMSWAYFYRKDPLKESLVTKVGKAMRPLVKAYLQADDTVTRAIELMMTKKVNIIPVFEGKKAVGIIRVIDILDYIGDML